MCGIAGVVSYTESTTPTPGQLSRMSACIAHRGPDASGNVTHSHSSSWGHATVAFAHRRLAVLDLDPRANQPFTLGPWHLVYNGELYNFHHLRKELAALHPQHAWQTTGDTEVLLLALITWGVDALPKLEGMFALAAWNDQDGTLLLARDRMGQKPLLFSVNEQHSPCDAIAFASDLPALKAIPWVRQDLNRQALAEYLRWGYIPAPSSIYRDIWKVEPGQWWRFSKGNVDCGHYYSLPRLPLTQSDDSVSLTAAAHAPQNLRALIDAAVARQTIADVPVGCFLSGGIDSSIIALGMVKAAQQAGHSASHVHTFCCGFDDPLYDERSHARSVARHLGTQHTEFSATPHLTEEIPLLARMCGEPFADSSLLPTYLLSRLTRQHVTVALSGDGGDELFAGYDRYRAMSLVRRLRFLPCKRIVASLMGSSQFKSRRARLARLLRAAALPAPHAYASLINLFDATSATMLFPSDVAREVPDVFSTFDDLSPADAAMHTDRLTYLPNDLLNKVDRASMAVALEVRSPFMDHQVIAAAGRLAYSQHSTSRHGKELLRLAYQKDLPPAVFARKKQGFGVPVGAWFRGPLQAMAQDLILPNSSWVKQHLHAPAIDRLWQEHQQLRFDHGQRLYSLLMLECWAKQT